MADCAIVVGRCSTPQEKYAAARRALLIKKQKVDNLSAEGGGQNIEREINEKAAARVVYELTGLNMQRVAKLGDATQVNLKHFRVRKNAGKIDDESFGPESLRIFDNMRANRIGKERIVETLKRMLQAGTQEQRRFDEAFFELMDDFPAASHLEIRCCESDVRTIGCERQRLLPGSVFGQMKYASTSGFTPRIPTESSRRQEKRSKPTKYYSLL